MGLNDMCENGELIAEEEEREGVMELLSQEAADDVKELLIYVYLLLFILKSCIFVK